MEIEINGKKYIHASARYAPMYYKLKRRRALAKGKPLQDVLLPGGYWIPVDSEKKEKINRNT